MVITVTGSSGTIGSELVRLLSIAGAPTRAILRNVSKAQPLAGVAWLLADLREQRSLQPALAGTTRLFLLTDNHAGFPKAQIAVLQAAEALRVAHVVKLS